MAPPQLSLRRPSLRTYPEWVPGHPLPRNPDRPSTGLRRRIVLRCGRPLPLDVGRRRGRNVLRVYEDRRNPGSCKPLCPEKPEVDLCRRCTCFGVDPCHLPDLLGLVHSSGVMNGHQDSFVDKTIRLGELTKIRVQHPQHGDEERSYVRLGGLLRPTLDLRCHVYFGASN